MSGSTLPTVMTAAGLQALTAAVLDAMLIANVTETNPGYTANLPGSLIDDISGTDVGALLIMDQARQDLVNSITPLGANPFLLYQMGAVYGVAQGQGSNTSVYVVFTASAAGVVIQAGFIISDGTNQYIIQDGGITGASLSTVPLYAVAVNSGAFAVPANTVVNLVSGAPTGVTLTVTNPSAGTPATSVQTISDYRGQVIQAGLATCQGTATLLKTALQNIAGVQPQLIAVQSISGLFKIIVGGGDPYLIAGAIFQAIGNPGQLVGSTLQATGITQANPGVVTTNLNHGFVTGNTITISGSTVTAYNGTYTITVLSQTTFSIATNTTGFAAYTGGGVITPNNRNQVISILDYPDTYSIPFVVPPQQVVTIALLWNTNSTNPVSATAVAQLGSVALVNYINSVAVGAPLNLFELQNAFQTGIASILPTPALTRMVFTVDINGVSVSPTSGTGIIAGDPESYFYATTSGITITKG